MSADVGQPETIHAPDREDALNSAPLCEIEDPAAVRSFTFTDINCTACMRLIEQQPGTLALFVDLPQPERR